MAIALNVSVAVNAEATIAASSGISEIHASDSENGQFNILDLYQTFVGTLIISLQPFIVRSGEHAR